MNSNENSSKSKIKSDIEKFDIVEIRDGCHFVCQNLSTINILLIIILFVLGYMFFEESLKNK